MSHRSERATCLSCTSELGGLAKYCNFEMKCACERSKRGAQTRKESNKQRQTHSSNRSGPPGCCVVVVIVLSAHKQTSTTPNRPPPALPVSVNDRSPCSRENFWSGFEITRLARSSCCRPVRLCGQRSTRKPNAFTCASCLEVMRAFAYTTRKPFTRRFTTFY